VKEEPIVALLSQRNVEEAARVADILPRTLYRWLTVLEFQGAYREARRAAFGQAIARLQQGTLRSDGYAFSFSVASC
jgi:hypothetical protein